jgi:hypothetical protein
MSRVFDEHLHSMEWLPSMSEQPEAAAQLSSSRFPLGGIYATVVLMLFITLGFFFHERPITYSHLVGGVVLGGSALALLTEARLMSPTFANGKWLALGQIVATGLFVAVLFTQHVERTVVWWVTVSAMTIGPVAYSAAGFVRSTHR